MMLLLLSLLLLGFSNYFPRPAYQSVAVDNYFNKYGSNFPSSKLYNQTGRGIPDVAAVGVNFPIVVGGFTYGVDGTSCSSPTFSAIVALLNDLRLNAGKSPLGFLNPLIYQNGAAFNDITTGNNPGCSTKGFYAAQAWDPITGQLLQQRLPLILPLLLVILPLLLYQSTLIEETCCGCLY